MGLLNFLFGKTLNFIIHFLEHWYFMKTKEMLSKVIFLEVKTLNHQENQ
jgi:hypothetical protein